MLWNSTLGGRIVRRDGDNDVLRRSGGLVRGVPKEVADPGAEIDLGFRPAHLPVVTDMASMPSAFRQRNRSVRRYPPVPVRFTFWRLFAAVSVKVNAPVAAPIAVGLNVTPIVQLAPAAMLAPQVLLATAKPETVNIEILVQRAQR